MAWLAPAVVLQTATPTPGVGPEELVEYGPALVRVAWFVATFVVVLLLGWYVGEPVLVRTINRRNRNNPTLREALARYFRVFVVVVAVFVAAGVAGYGRFLTSSAIVVAAATLVVGVAGQTVIGSLLSGIVLVMDPEFNIGDYIQWENGEGTVRSIRLRVTRVQTPNGELVTVPNTVLTSQAITRPYGRNRYRVVDRVGLAYDDDVEEAVGLLEAVAGELDAVVSEPEPAAYVDEFGGDAVFVDVHYWIESPSQRDVLDVRSSYARAVKRRLDAAGITISPPSKRDLEGRIEVAESA